MSTLQATPVETDTTVCPDLVDPRVYGHHSSHVSRGRRLWVFYTTEGANAFERAVARGLFRRKPVGPRKATGLRGKRADFVIVDDLDER